MIKLFLSVLLTIVVTASPFTNLSNSPSSDGQPSWSKDGERILFSTDRDHPFGAPPYCCSAIYVMNADGSDQSGVLFTPGTNAEDPDWSPDGSKIAYSQGYAGSFDIYVMNADGTEQTRLTTNGGQSPAWSPNGDQIAYAAGSIYVMKADGSKKTKLAAGSHPAWSPDGDHIAFVFQYDVHVMDADGGDVTNLTLDAKDPYGYDASEGSPSWSPDGSKILFTSNRDSGYNETLYIMNADGSGQVPVPDAPDSYTFDTGWSPDGAMIFFSTDFDGSFDVYAMDAGGLTSSAGTMD